MTNTITLNQTRKSFKDKVVLSDINLSLPKGSVTGLLGPNGAGKTTLMQIILGMLKPDSGTSTVMNEESWQLNSDIKQKIGYVPQQPMFFEWMTVAEALKYQQSFYPKWDQVKAEQLLARWQLTGTDKIKKLSLGQKQRLAIIQALAIQPEILILDEPVASLDPAARREFIQQLIEINIEQQTSILFSTHIVSDLERIASDVAILHQGVIQYMGALDNLKETVKKVILRADSELPKNSPFKSNTLNYQHKGLAASAVLKNADNIDFKALEKQFKLAITVQDLDLESIYMELVK